jgi:hypothetical protein
MCSSSFCRRGVASSDAADSGLISPFGRSVVGAGDGAAATGGRFRWNREHPRPLWAPGVRGETILRYKVNGSADMTEIALVRASQR